MDRKIDTGIFKVDRDSPVTMTDQLADGIRRAILTGRLREGELLPTVKQLVKISGACDMVVRGAIRKLTAAGLVRPRRHVGCRVCARGGQTWRGYVLIVTRQLSTYYFSVQTAIIRDHLLRAGYFVSDVFVRWRDGRPDFTQLDEALTHPTSMVVVLSPESGVSEHVAESGIRMVTVNSDLENGSFNGVNLRVDWSTAMPGLVKRCRRAGVKTVLRLGTRSDPERPDAMLREAGIRVSAMYLRSSITDNGVEEAEKGTLDVFERRFVREKGGREWLPDLIISSDDYMTRGMLTAFAHYGVRIPEDVAVVTLANKGNGPWYFKSLAKMELDPATAGRNIANAVLLLLHGRKAGPSIVMSAKYVDGESFPVPEKRGKRA